MGQAETKDPSGPWNLSRGERFVDWYNQPGWTVSIDSSSCWQLWLVQFTANALYQIPRHIWAHDAFDVRDIFSLFATNRHFREMIRA